MTVVFERDLCVQSRGDLPSWAIVNMLFGYVGVETTATICGKHRRLALVDTRRVYHRAAVWFREFEATIMGRGL